jgi:hypothetical protein
MSRRINWRTVAVVAAGLILAYGAWHWSIWQARASIAAGFGARIACSCRYVEGRDIKSCRSDFAGLPSMWIVRLSDRPEERAVDASVPLLARRSARAVPGFGCVIDGRK